MAGEDDQVEQAVVPEVEKDDGDKAKEGETAKAKDRSGNKARDAWESESAFQRNARKAEYLVVVKSQEDKDKSIKQQAKSLHEPLEETELTIEYLKEQPEPKEKKEKDKLVQRIEGLRRRRKRLHEWLYELCIAQKHGWKVVTTYQHDKLEGEAKEVQKVVEKVRKEEEAEGKKGSAAKRARSDNREPKASHPRRGPRGNSYAGEFGGYGGYGGQWSGPQPMYHHPPWYRPTYGGGSAPAAPGPPAATATSSGPTASGAPRTCFQSRKEGHVARFCPERK